MPSPNLLTERDEPKAKRESQSKPQASLDRIRIGEIADGPIRHEEGHGKCECAFNQVERGDRVRGFGQVGLDDVRLDDGCRGVQTDVETADTDDDGHTVDEMG